MAYTADSRCRCSLVQLRGVHACFARYSDSTLEVGKSPGNPAPQVTSRLGISWGDLLNRLRITSFPIPEGLNVL